MSFNWTDCAPFAQYVMLHSMRLSSMIMVSLKRSLLKLAADANAKSLHTLAEEGI